MIKIIQASSCGIHIPPYILITTINAIALDTNEIPVEYLLSLINNSISQTTCINISSAVIKIRPILFFTAPLFFSQFISSSYKTLRCRLQCDTWRQRLSTFLLLNLLNIQTMLNQSYTAFHIQTASFVIIGFITDRQLNLICNKLNILPDHC